MIFHAFLVTPGALDIDLEQHEEKRSKMWMRREWVFSLILTKKKFKLRPKLCVLHHWELKTLNLQLGPYFAQELRRKLKKWEHPLLKKENQYYNKSSHPNNTFAEMTWEDGGWKGPCGQGVALYKGIWCLVFGIWCRWLYTRVFGVDTVDSNHDDDRNGDNGKF